MVPDLDNALTHLCARGDDFDRNLTVLRRHRQAAVPILVKLLSHPDCDWRRAAAASLARLRSTPSAALPALLRMLRSHDTAGQIAAIAALDWIPNSNRSRATSAVIEVLRRTPRRSHDFTRTRDNLARALAAHHLGMRGGARGHSALSLAARDEHDPVYSYIKAALRRATRRTATARRRTRA